MPRLYIPSPSRAPRPSLGEIIAALVIVIGGCWLVGMGGLI